MTIHAQLKVVIIGAGFSATVLAANLVRFSATTNQALDITLIEKRPQFALGEAYSTPYPYHLLNVVANDMSAFPDEPQHFVEWLIKNKPPEINEIPLPELGTSFIPRCVYGRYLKALLETASASGKIKCLHGEAIDVIPEGKTASVVLADGKRVVADKVILAVGNLPPQGLPCPQRQVTIPIHQAWDYKAPSKFAATDNVLIVGTGLSMIDAVLTLYHQQHQGHIYALSRHGLLPLPHRGVPVAMQLPQDNLPTTTFSFLRYARRLAKEARHAEFDWRELMQALRGHFPTFWQQAEHGEKARFLRHVLPYWNIHRHRVPESVAKILEALQANGTLSILAARLLEIETDQVLLRERHHSATKTLTIQQIINCIGPASKITQVKQPLITALFKRQLVASDSLQIGLACTEDGKIKDRAGNPSPFLYTLGPLVRGEFWETSAVPDIRKQCYQIAKHILH